MSLLLDALKQAEQSKKQQQAAGPDKAEPGIQDLSSENAPSLNDTTDETSSEQWTELDVLPDFDLTIIENEDVSAEYFQADSGSDLSAVTSSDLQLEPVSDQPDQPVVLQALDVSAESASKEITQLEEDMAVETGLDKTGALQADTEETDEKTVTNVSTVEQTNRTEESAVDTVIRQEDMDAARAILQDNHSKKRYKSYGVLLIAFLLLGGVGSYFLFFMEATQTSSMAENYLPADDMMMADNIDQAENGNMEDTMAAGSEILEAESSASSLSSGAPGNNEVANQLQARQETITPKKNILAKKESALHSIRRPRAAKVQFHQPRFQSLEASSPIKIKIKRPSPRIDQDLADRKSVV